MKSILTNKWFKFAVVGVLYTLWVIWLGIYWWFLGLIVIFDIYITQKVHWAFWKKKNPPEGKQTKVVEWVDAIIFAVIAASFIRMKDAAMTAKMMASTHSTTFVCLPSGGFFFFQKAQCTFCVI